MEEKSIHLQIQQKTFRQFNSKQRQQRRNKICRLQTHEPGLWRLTHSSNPVTALRDRRQERRRKVAQWHEQILPGSRAPPGTEVFRKRRLFSPQIYTYATISEVIFVCARWAGPTDLQTPTTQATSRPPAPQPPPARKKPKKPPTGDRRRNETRAPAPHLPPLVVLWLLLLLLLQLLLVVVRRLHRSPAAAAAASFTSSPPARLPAFAPLRRRMRRPHAPPGERERARTRARDGERDRGKKGQRRDRSPLPSRIEAHSRSARPAPAPLCGPPRCD